MQTLVAKKQNRNDNGTSCFSNMWNRANPPSFHQKTRSGKVSVRICNSSNKCFEVVHNPAQNQRTTWNISNARKSDWTNTKTHGTWAPKRSQHADSRREESGLGIHVEIGVHPGTPKLSTPPRGGFMREWIPERGNQWRGNRYTYICIRIYLYLLFYIKRTIYKNIVGAAIPDSSAHGPGASGHWSLHRRILASRIIFQPKEQLWSTILIFFERVSIWNEKIIFLNRQVIFLTEVFNFVWTSHISELKDRFSKANN